VGVKLCFWENLSALGAPKTVTVNKQAINIQVSAGNRVLTFVTDDFRISWSWLNLHNIEEMKGSDKIETK
jgi:hypothetical protein